MRIFFIHDHPFYQENNMVYSGGGLPSSTWNNYLLYFSDITIFGRLSSNLKDKSVLSSGNQKVKFVLTSHYSSFPSIFFNLKKLISQIKLEISKSDVVLVRLPSLLGFIAAFIALRVKKKIIVEQVGNTNEALASHGSLSGKLIGGAFELVNKYIVKKANYVSYVTDNKLQKDYPTKGISVGLSDVLIEKIIKKEEIDDSRFYEREFKIGLVGGFDAKYKGQNILLQALALFDKKVKENISLSFVGKGNYGWLSDIAKNLCLLENIKFIGPKESGKEIFDFLLDMSLYVQPSYTEGMPRALLEAMSVGCPVLGSKVGGIPDVVSSTFIHNSGDYKTLSDQILKLYNNRELLLKESIRSIEMVQPFLKSNLDKKRDSFYREIIKDLQNV